MLAVYTAATDADAWDAATHANGDNIFLMGTRSVLRAASKANPKTFQYQFTRVNGIGRRIKWGAFHASEVPYVFGNLPDSVYGTSRIVFGDFSVDADTYTDDDAKLAKAMTAAWVRFAKTGDPAGGGLAWPAFKDRESYIEFGDRITTGVALRKKQLDFLSDYASSLRDHAVTASTGASH